MSQYQQSQNMAEVEKRHPFPWTQQIMQSPMGGIIRMLDARGQEVNLFEMTALCSIVTRHIAAKPKEANEPVPQSGGD